MTRKLCTFIALSATFLVTHSSVVAQDTSAQLLKAVGDLVDQQAQLAENQTKIDEQIADIAEKVRVARIYMSRAGGKHNLKPPPKKR